MFTVCSKCNLRLTVTAMDLRAAQGYVRCGRCHNVFNALAALADDPARQAEQATTADTQRRPVLTAPEPLPPEPAPPPATTAADEVESELSLEFNPASTNINEVFIEAAAAQRSGTFESIILSAEEPTPGAAAEDPVIAPQALSAPISSPSTEQSTEIDVRRMRDALAEPGPGEPAAAAEPLAVTPDSEATITHEAILQPAASADDPYAESPEADLLKPVQRAPRVPRWATVCVAIVLTLCLVAQVVHHYRTALAETPLLQGPLTALYQALGMPLAARWNIAQYEVRQLGATTDGAAAGELVVRASISNRAPRDQPLPLLRVIMQDRFGNRVAGRDLRPAEYLAPGAPRTTLMSPGQRVDVQVALQDPGQAATGFEIDACMPRPDHTVTCANDPGNH